MKSPFLLGVLTLVSCLSLEANIIPTLINVTGSGPYTWNYSATLFDGQSLDPTLTNGDTCFGSPCVPAGTFFTIYDFANYVAGSITAPSGWEATVALLGRTPQSVDIVDDPLLQNLTFIYVGGAVQPTDPILGFSAQSISSTQLDGSFSSQGTDPSLPDFVSTTANIGSVTVPMVNSVSAVPEPGSAFIVGAVMLIIIIWRSKVSRTI